MVKKAVATMTPTAIGLPRHEVYIWTVALDRPREGWPRLLGCLSPDEQVRAGRFRFEPDRLRFVVARAALREILGSCIGLPAQEVVFEYGLYGKPALGNGGARQIGFNLAHCQGLALIAVAAGRRVGVDLELISSEVAEGRMRIAERFFSAAEVAALEALPRRLQDEAFLACWTRKEAYLKARGEGLSTPLDGFSVSLTPGEPAALLDCPGAQDEIQNWSLLSFTPAPHFIAAVAVEG